MTAFCNLTFNATSLEFLKGKGNGIFKSCITIVLLSTLILLTMPDKGHRNLTKDFSFT